MKALLITTVEQEAQTTMGQKPREFNQIKIIPWKEVAEIEVTRAGHYSITCLEGPAIEACMLDAIDLNSPEAFNEIQKLREALPTIMEIVRHESEVEK
ncbi:MAG: hypothetical protein KAV87_27355 [Desulfobacteraceae bacterium]|nr:hypothetical protein [Desulfobacteraceae bacterium]